MHSGGCQFILQGFELKVEGSLSKIPAVAMLKLILVFPKSKSVKVHNESGAEGRQGMDGLISRPGRPLI